MSSGKLHQKITYRMKIKNKKYLPIIPIALMLAIIFYSDSVFAAWNRAELMTYGLPSSSIFDIISGIMEWILQIVGFLGVIAFAIAGSLYLLSAGNDNMLKQAKAAMKYAIIGVIVALAGLVALQAAYVILDGVGQI